MEHEAADSFNDGFVQMMYESYLNNPESVSEEWRNTFAGRATNGTTNTATVAAPPAAQSAVQAPAQPAAATATPPPAAPSPNGAETLPPHAQLMKGPAAGLVRNMNESLTVPTATTFRTVAVSNLDGQRRQLNEQLKAQGRKLSFTHLVAWAIVEAWREVPVMGHTFHQSGNKPYRVAHEHLHFGLAVDVEKPDGSRGLMVPVIKDADTLDARGFFDRYDELVAKARAGKLGLDDMIGTTLTLTNPGGLGTVASVPRLMASQGTIVATGSIAFPVEFQHLGKQQLQQLGVSKVMTMTSTYDHRVIQGAESGAFLKLVDQLLQGEHDFYGRVAQAMGVGGPGGGGGATAPAAEPQQSPAEATMSIRLPGAVQPARIEQAEQAEQNRIMAERGSSLGRPVHNHLLAEPQPYQSPPTTPVSTSAEQLASVAAAMALVKAYRTHGHLAAMLDPLGAEPVGDPSLDPSTIGLDEEIMETIPASVLRIGVEGETLADALPRLREKYCSTIAYEIEHIGDHDQRVWLRRMIEAGEHRRALSEEEKRSLLVRLTDVEVFERFVRRAYLAQKQFSIEGLDMMVPMLDELVEIASLNGADQVVLGMAHRGRLNVLTHILGREYASILREFEAEGRVIEGTALPSGGTGDVKYHQGARGTYESATGQMEITLSPNPSHLEVVNPVVVGRTRAEQTLQKGRELYHDSTAAVPVLIHGDAAFPGQGIVPETLNLQSLDGYSTGGTIHIIANNQLGFTTMPEDSRSTRYASDLAKGFDVPIIHVNADDPEACLAAVRLAMAYRNRFHRDAIIDLIGYRRHGHNEGDEPAYTQPRMYQVIKDHPRVRELFAQQLVAEGIVDQATVQEMYDMRYSAISEVHERVLKLGEREASELNEPQGDFIDRTQAEEPETTLDEATVRRLNEQLVTVPDDFTVHPKLQRQLDKRRKMPDAVFDWATAEGIALASLLVEGIPVRMTGQDTARGTFAHRHMRLHDINTGETFEPVSNLPEASAGFELHNSPLSEAGCLGFEYGYSIAAPHSLVLWEAQFGDFVNNAQVILDQFITSALAKWGDTTRLTLLLPHGYEGNGPEHSNAHLDRFLSRAAEGNIRVAVPTSAGQYFHLLRRQGLKDRQRPLVVMTPKGLLRAPYAMSPLSDLTTGRFEWVLDDPVMEQADRSKVKRLVFCSGKVYYDLAGYGERAKANDTAVVRVELLYPFPKKQLTDLLATYPNVREVVWAQEEPQNFGAYSYMLQRLEPLLPEKVQWSYAGRPKRSAPSEGYTSVHLLEQERIVRRALGLG